MRCTAMTKNCRVCGYRYPANSKDVTHCPQCGKERQCERKATKGYKVCQVHGSGSPAQGRPGGKPSFVATRLNALPERLRPTYEASIDDPCLLEFQRDLALSEALITDMLKRLDTGESGELWLKLKEANQNYLKAQSRAAASKAPEDITEMRRCLEEQTDLINRGASDFSTRTDLLRFLEQRRRTIDSEYKRLEKLQMMVRLDAFVAFAELVGRVVGELVESPETVNAISYQIEMLLNTNKPAGMIVENVGT